MKRTLVWACLIAITLPGCNTFDKKEELEPPVKTIRDQNTDVSFQSFVGMLNRAIHRRDKAKLATMMTGDFGYSLPDGEGISGAFNYWDKENLWPALEATVRAGFAPAGAYMVAPANFATQGPEYQGYRLGVRRIGGAWRFVYFVGN